LPNLLAGSPQRYRSPEVKQKLVMQGLYPVATCGASQASALMLSAQDFRLSASHGPQHCVLIIEIKSGAKGALGWRGGPWAVRPLTPHFSASMR
jgi:hypothetical protein